MFSFAAVHSDSVNCSRCNNRSINSEEILYACLKHIAGSRCSTCMQSYKEFVEFKPWYLYEDVQTQTAERVFEAFELKRLTD